MATTKLRERVTLKGDEYGATSKVYSDGVVLASVIRYESETCSLDHRHPVVIGGEFRGTIAKSGTRWALMGQPGDITFHATREKALRGAIRRALRDITRRVC